MKDAKSQLCSILLAPGKWVTILTAPDLQRSEAIEMAETLLSMMKEAGAGGSVAHPPVNTEGP